jgi:hypothetical protein
MSWATNITIRSCGLSVYNCFRELVATRRGPYPHTDGGVEVRRVFYALRPAIEPPMAC